MISTERTGENPCLSPFVALRVTGRDFNYVPGKFPLDKSLFIFYTTIVVSFY